MASAIWSLSSQSERAKITIRLCALDYRVVLSLSFLWRSILEKFFSELLYFIPCYADMCLPS